MADAGKILIMPKGTYSSTSEYEVLDLVNHRGTSWVAKKSVNGIEPSDSNSEYWFKMAGYIVADNLTTSAEGYVLDARQGKLLRDELAVERARINQFTKLAEGSTTGDAELIDARVGADGKTYTNLGEANRTQFANLKSDLSKVKNMIFDVSTLTTCNVAAIPNIEKFENYSGDTRSSGVALQPLKDYESYVLIADRDCEIYVDESIPTGKYYAISIGKAFTERTEESSGAYLYKSSNSARYRNNDNNLPTEESKLPVSEGDVIVFTFLTGNTFSITGYVQEEMLESTLKSVYSGTITKNGDSIDIFTDSAHYLFKRITNESIRIDTWRLYSGDLLDEQGQYFNMWDGSDAEGVVRLKDEGDFLGGYHGDEYMTNMSIFIDGKEVDLSTNFSDKPFKTMEIYVESELYHCNTSPNADTIAFSRNKRLVFENNKVTIGNCFTAKEDVTLVECPTSLFQVDYKNADGEEITTSYSVNSDFKKYNMSEASTSYPRTSDKMNSAIIETKYGNIKFKLIKCDVFNGYQGVVARDFILNQNRIKVYFYSNVNEYVLNEGKSLLSEFEFEIVK